MRMVAKKENMEFFFTLLNKSENEIELEMYSTIYRLVRDVKEKNESGISEQPEEWVNAGNNKMSMSGSLANAIVEAVKNSGK